MLIFILGKQMVFIRSCFVLDFLVVREGCFNDIFIYSLLIKCYIFCFQDGCNGFYVIFGYVFFVVFVSVFFYFIYYGRNIF